jgi:hypothetical protein
MAELPPYPSVDSYDRSQFIPMVLPVPPLSGADHAVIEFGYQEYGDPSAFHCTTRHDACLAATAQLSPNSSPFFFQSEHHAGLPCSTGCTIAIPAISQRVLFFRIVYLAGSKMVATSGVSVADVP